jgi:four helix bundle protein
MTPQELRDRTKQFGVDIVNFCETLPGDPRSQEIAAQLVDAATGVGANYRAVCRPRSDADFINKMAITLECADESLYWLEVLIESCLANTLTAQQHRNEAEELTRILSASVRTARANAAKTADKTRRGPTARKGPRPNR